MQLQTRRKLHKLFSMKARTDLPLAILVVLLSVPVSLVAADETAPVRSAPPTASLPDNEAQAQARAALHGEDTATSTQPMTEPAAVKAEPMATSVGTAAPQGAMPLLVGPQPDTEVQAEARRVLRSEEPGITATLPAAAMVEPQEAAPQTTPTVAATQPAPKPVPPAATTAQQDSRLTGLQPPALPISAAQQQQLDQLLQQYRANQISPAQYHSQRAEILAGK